MAFGSKEGEGKEEGGEGSGEGEGSGDGEESLLRSAPLEEERPGGGAVKSGLGFASISAPGDFQMEPELLGAEAPFSLSSAPAKFFLAFRMGPVRVLLSFGAPDDFARFVAGLRLFVAVEVSSEESFAPLMLLRLCPLLCFGAGVAVFGLASV